MEWIKFEINKSDVHRCIISPMLTMTVPRGTVPLLHLEIEGRKSGQIFQLGMVYSKIFNVGKFPGKIIKKGFIEVIVSN